MKWFDKWFSKRVRKAWEEAHTVQVATNVIRSYDGLGSNGLNLTVYKADGGTIVEFRHYDPVKDRSMNSLHIITNADDFAGRLSEIITMELMKHGIN